MFQKNTRTDQVVDDAKKLAEDIRLLASDAMENSGSAAATARAKANHAYQQARENMQKKAHDIDDFTHEKPWVAVGIAAAVGAVLGAMLTRRR